MGITYYVISGGEGEGGGGLASGGGVLLIYPKKLLRTFSGTLEEGTYGVSLMEVWAVCYGCVTGVLRGVLRVDTYAVGFMITS